LGRHGAKAQRKFAGGPAAHAIGMNRRAFLQTGACAILGAPVLRAQSPKRRIRVGFLGVAHSHAAGKWKALQNSGEFELVGIAEESPKLRTEFEKLGAKVLNARELLNGTDVVVVESAVRDLAANAKLALAARKHVHVEKPPGKTVAELRELVKLAREHERVLQVGYMWRYHPGFSKIFEAVRAGWLGKVSLVRGMIGNLLATERRAEWAEFHGGAMFELGCHLVDPLIRLLGQPVDVKSTLRRHASVEDELKDNNAVIFEFKDALGVITNSTHQPNSSAQRSFEVFGTNGSAILKPIEPPTLQIDLAKAAGPYKSGVQTIALPAYERYVGDFVKLSSAIRGEKPLSVTLDEELRVHEALLRACEMS
jgi:predicted dehydrogenase